jgi:hypothetical protein
MKDEFRKTYVLRYAFYGGRCGILGIWKLDEILEN